ncbi:unnamed protein product [Brassica napus]|uniref:(rape) hypothetical protein n=1 Tax=Brassica napus TaxID=3708 RepID=A0A816P3C5_BRANA|nr:unnamed protein product [Brassica napus]
MSDSLVCHHLNPRRSTPESIGGRIAPFRIRPGRIAAPIRFPPDNFKQSLTLFSKSFSSLPRAPRGATGSGHDGALTLSGAPFQGTWARSIAEALLQTTIQRRRRPIFKLGSSGSLAVTKRILVSFFSSAY